MHLIEFLVRNVQRFVPTILLRLCVRYYFKLYFGWRLRRGSVVVRQINLDRRGRKSLPVTTDVDKANEQHYGNDPAFFQSHLGPCLKYSACEWPAGKDVTLVEAEVYTIRKYQEMARLDSLEPGSRVLELGCGWGSLTLANAERYPRLRFVAFSNSPQQIGFIRSEAEKRGLDNIEAHVEDFADFCTENSVIPVKEEFDAAVAIETIEHARDIRTLLDYTAKRLRPGARLFVQSLLHQSRAYLMDDSNWMGRNFFSGGSILALNSYFHLSPRSLFISEMYPVNGADYSRTLLSWLEALEMKSSMLVGRYGSDFYEGFRLFYIMCAEAFAANSGNEYMCGYYVFEKQ